jgi:2-phosphosulfolactate phosphatase
MRISIQSLLAGARSATGAVAATAAVALANGASRIIMVATVEEALTLRQTEDGAICMGEVRGRAPDAFDFGNSPLEISTISFGGRTAIRRASAGTQGIVAATPAAEPLCRFACDGGRDSQSAAFGNS